MITDTIVADPKDAVKKPIEAFLSNANDGSSLYNVYLEFILYWTSSDVESYHNALMTVAGRKEKNFLQCMATRKREMVRTFSVRRVNGEKTWFESTVGGNTRSSEDYSIRDDDFEPIRSLIDAFHFTYQKEYESLKLFEKVSGSNLEAAIRTLLESAAEHQRHHILYLDTMLSRVQEVALPAIIYSTQEARVRRWL